MIPICAIPCKGTTSSTARHYSTPYIWGTLSCVGHPCGNAQRWGNLCFQPPIAFSSGKQGPTSDSLGMGAQDICPTHLRLIHHCWQQENDGGMLFGDVFTQSAPKNTRSAQLASQGSSHLIMYTCTSAWFCRLHWTLGCNPWYASDVGKWQS